tara:strand:+ start:4158 stop:5264 length:1107 start_codon:yes stop_codon:yes gene_type:complete
MESIIHPDSSFDFSTISLDNPMPLAGGSYFTKLSHSDKELPLYIQLSKCVSKNGIIRNNSTKKAYIDLQFNNHETEILNFIENLETKCRELIFKKKDLWFQSEISEEDIENMFIAPIKPYKSGKFYILRSNIPSSKHLKKDGCLVYDENERNLDFSYIKDSSTFLSLIHIEGIKFSSKCFQLEVSVRQIMILSVEENIKNNCLIKSSKIESNETLEKNRENVEQEGITNFLQESKDDFIQDTTSDPDKEYDKKDIIDSEESYENHNKNKKNENDKLKSKINKNTEISDHSNLEEINLNIEDVDNEEISIKKPNEVYIEIYKSAILKANQIKKAAVEAFSEAKKIKEKYNLNNIDLSDDKLNLLTELQE